jgi:hypothetical protein
LTSCALAAAVSKPAKPHNAAHTIENLFMFPPHILSLTSTGAFLKGLPIIFKSDPIGQV